MQCLLSYEFYKNFNIFITLYRKQKILVDSKWLEIAHIRILVDLRGRKNIWQFDIDVRDLHYLCYLLYIDKVVWLESMLDNVTSDCVGSCFFPLLMHFERFNKGKQLSVVIIHLYNDMTWKNSTSVHSQSLTSGTMNIFKYF